MRLTFILPEFPLYPSGGAKVVYEYANGLARLGHTITIIHPRTLFYAGLQEDLLSKFIAILRGIKSFVIFGCRTQRQLPSWHNLDHDIISISVPFLWSSYIPNGDIVCATFWRTAEYVHLLPPRCGSKLYFIQHHEINMGPEKRVNKTWLLPLKKIVIAKWLLEIGQKIGANNIWHVPNSIDHENFYITNIIKGRPPSVAMLYSHFIWKGSEEGLAALNMVKERFPDLSVKLFGIVKRPANFPQWIEYHHDPDLLSLRDNIYNKSSIYLCSSWSEGWGLPVTEAMACGCAIVTTANGGIDDFIIDGLNGLIVPARRPDLMAEAILKLLQNRQLLESLANAGLVKVKDFTLKKSLEKFNDIINNMKNNI